MKHLHLARLVAAIAFSAGATVAFGQDAAASGAWLFGTSGPAVRFDPEDVTLRTPAADSVHGWQFTARRAITITHLGVYDVDDDGFLDGNHDVALWRASDQELLSDGTLHVGAGDPLVDHFRYVDVQDVTLESGRDYVVGFYTKGPLFRRVLDDMASDIVGLQTSRTIDIVQPRFIWPADGAITFPTSESATDRFGPNFLFTLGETCEPCDMNCDGSIDAADIEPFLDLLFGGAAPCGACTGDVDGDGNINALDIEPFLGCLFP